jgi:hypothetical protein
MSETTDTTPDTTPDTTEPQPGDGSPVNEVPDAPTVVDPTPDSEGDSKLEDLQRQLDDVKRQLEELQDRETDPAPAPAPTAKDRFVEWDDHDEWGNPRVFFGVVLGEAPYNPGRINVARLVPARLEGYDPAQLRPLES